MRQLRLADPHFPAPLNPGEKTLRWHASQLDAYHLLRESRRARAAARRNVARRFEEHGLQPAGPREGLRRISRRGPAGAPADFFQVSDYETTDGVYALEYEHLRPPGSPMGKWRLTCRGDPVAEGAASLSEAREMLRLVRMQDRRYGTGRALREQAAFLTRYRQTMEGASGERPCWAALTPGTILGEDVPLTEEEGTGTPRSWGVVWNVAMGEVVAVPLRARGKRGWAEEKMLIALLREGTDRRGLVRLMRSACEEASSRPRTALIYLRTFLPEIQEQLDS